MTVPCQPPFLPCLPHLGFIHSRRGSYEGTRAIDCSQVAKQEVESSGNGGGQSRRVPGVWTQPVLVEALSTTGQDLEGLKDQLSLPSACSAIQEEPNEGLERGDLVQAWEGSPWRLLAARLPAICWHEALWGPFSPLAGTPEPEGTALRDFVITDSQLSGKRIPFCFQTFNFWMYVLLWEPPVFVYVLPSLDSNLQKHGHICISLLPTCPLQTARQLFYKILNLCNLIACHNMGSLWKAFVHLQSASKMTESCIISHQYEDVFPLFLTKWKRKQGDLKPLLKFNSEVSVKR